MITPSFSLIHEVDVGRNDRAAVQTDNSVGADGKSADAARHIGESNRFAQRAIIRAANAVARVGGFGGDKVCRPHEQLQRAFFLDVVIGQCAPILQEFAREKDPLYIELITSFVLNFCLNVFNAVARFDIQRDGSRCGKLNKNLHSRLCL